LPGSRQNIKAKGYVSKPAGSSELQVAMASERARRGYKRFVFVFFAGVDADFP
jgi:hypothetical protein